MIKDFQTMNEAVDFFNKKGFRAYEITHPVLRFDDAGTVYDTTRINGAWLVNQDKHGMMIKTLEGWAVQLPD